MVIPTYEFLCFPFLKYKNPLSHLESFNYIIENKEFNSKENREKNNKALNIFLFLISIFYLFGFIIGLFSDSAFLKNFVELIILLVVYSYYLILILCYIITSTYILIKDPLKLEQHILPDINLLSYSINPIFKDNYEENGNIKEKDKFYDIRNIIRIFLLFFLIIITFILSYYIKRGIFLTIIHLLFNISFLILSITLNFPFFFKNNKTFDNFFQSKIILNKNAKSRHPFMFPAIRIICNLIFISISGILCLGFYFMEEPKKVNFKDKFSQIFEKEIDKDVLLPNICNTYIYNLPLYLYIPFINDAYYYETINDSNKKSSFDYDNYRKMFFDETYDINIIGNLIKEKGTFKMVQYNLKNSEKNISITIFSIKGTSHRKDLYMDFQLFIPSVFLNLLSTFSVFGNEMDNFIYKIIEYSLSIPYRLFVEFLFIDEYIKKLRVAYSNAIDSRNIYKNIVIVGHSLGGGLSKILGRITKNQAISLSGPGIDAFHTKWTSDGNSINFDISFIDLVPDKDLVPRVEVSGGTIYRIICTKGPFVCHDKALSLCETLAMCRNSYYEFYCYKMANLNSDQISEILNNSELEKKIKNKE